MFSYTIENCLFAKKELLKDGFSEDDFYLHDVAYSDRYLDGEPMINCKDDDCISALELYKQKCLSGDDNMYDYFMFNETNIFMNEFNNLIKLNKSDYLVISYVYKFFDSIKEQNVINDILTQIDIEKVSIPILIGFLTIIHTNKEHIQCYNQFLSKVEYKINNNLPEPRANKILKRFV